MFSREMAVPDTDMTIDRSKIVDGCAATPRGDAVAVFFLAQNRCESDVEKPMPKQARQKAQRFKLFDFDA